MTIPTPQTPEHVLRHTVVDPPATSLFLRDGPVAAQLLLTDGAVPRVLVAFAAGNSGMALWFEPTPQPIRWQALSEPKAVSRVDGHGRPLHGIEVELLATGSPSLVIRRALLGSVRVLRDHQFDGRLPARGQVSPQAVLLDSVSWSRDRLDGAPGYRLQLQVEHGTARCIGTDAVELRATPGQDLRLRLCALTGDEALQPLPLDALLNADAADLPGARACLEFLAFEDRLLAGSWRFHTYFGRDTLMSVRLLLPVLQPAAVEAALASVLTRLSPTGEVAHEEDVGEFPILTRLARGELPDDAPIYDYKMVDDDFMLLPVLAAYVLDTAAGRQRAAVFLAREDFGTRVLRNIACVLEKAAPFGRHPVATQLVPLKAGEIVGDWRDSADGLAGGVYAYSVNAVLVPVALQAAQALMASGLLAPSLRAEPLIVRQAPREMAELAQTWERLAPPLFEVRRSAVDVDAAVARDAAAFGLPLDADAAGQAIEFSALALDAQSQPLPVMHSDFGFALLLSDPPPERLARELATLMRPFPAGLMTDVGLLVANAVFADNAALRARFGIDRYHGAVVWSWQQAMLAAGLQRQLQRNDLPAVLLQALQAAQGRLWRAIEATRSVAESELWSWAYAPESGYRVQAFGPLCATADESNAAQLWSTVYLAVKPPLA